MKKLLIYILISLLGLSFLTSISSARDIKTLELNPSKDSYVNNSEPTTNYGSASDLYAYYTSPPLVADEYILMAFDLSKVPFNSKITSAYLDIYGQAETEPQSVKAHFIESDWQETQVTYANFNNQYAAGSASSRLIMPTFEAYTFDITNMVDIWYSGTLPNYGLVLTDGTDDLSWSKFKSKEAADATQKPKLTIRYYVKDMIDMIIDAAPNKGDIDTGETVTIGGKLQTVKRSPLGNEFVQILRAINQGGSKALAKSKWKKVAKAKTNKKGRFSVKIKPRQTAIYKAYYAGDGAHNKAYSKKFKIKVKR